MRWQHNWLGDRWQRRAQLSCGWKLPRLGGRKLVFLGKLPGPLRDALRPACASARLGTAGVAWVALIQQAFDPVQRQHKGRQHEGWQLVAAGICATAGGNCGELQDQKQNVFTNVINIDICTSRSDDLFYTSLSRVWEVVYETVFQEAFVHYLKPSRSVNVNHQQNEESNLQIIISLISFKTATYYFIVSNRRKMNTMTFQIILIILLCSRSIVK